MVSFASSAPRRTLLHSCGIITMDPKLRVYTDGAIIIQDDKIVDIGQAADLITKHNQSAPSSDVESVDLSGKWVLPGLINTHCHTSQQLGRGIADDVDLLTWLHQRIWPYEAALSEEDSYVSTLLCALEQIRCGVTCIAEAGGQHVRGMARAIEEAGIRAALCASIMDDGEGLPPAWGAKNAQECIKFQEELMDAHHDTAEGRIRVWFGLRQIMNSTDDLLLRTKEAADRRHTGINMHVAEIPYENAHVAATRGCSHGTVTHLASLGLLGPNLLAAHSVWISEGEVQLFAAHGVNACHCPGSAMHMLGFSPVEEMLEAGVNVSLGTDGAPSNNRMSMPDEMYLASLINKGKHALMARGTPDPTALPAETVLKMATINGAKSVLWDNEIGSLEVGKKVALGFRDRNRGTEWTGGVNLILRSLLRLGVGWVQADLVVVNPNNFCMLPLHDPIASMVYSMRSENIESTMCNGRWLMRDKKVLTLQEDAVLGLAVKAAREVMVKAGVVLPKRMNHVTKDSLE